MLLLVCILKDYRLVEALLLGFVEEGVTGATVLEGRGMGQILGNEVPLFASLRGLFPGAGAESHVVFSAMTAEKAARCLDLVSRVCGNLDEPGAGVAFTVRLETMLGLAPEIV